MHKQSNHKIFSGFSVIIFQKLIFQQTTEALEKAMGETMPPKIAESDNKSFEHVEDISSDEEIEADDSGIHTDSGEAGSEINEEDEFFMNNECAMPCMHQVNKNSIKL